MKFRRSWQKGGVDLVTVGMSVIVMSIIATGTGLSISYSRDILIRQENYKKAAYILRGEMEQSIRQVYEWGRTMDQRPRELARQPLQSTFVNGNAPADEVVIWRDRIDVYDVLEITGSPDYWGVTCRATWQERDMTGGQDGSNTLQREIVMTTKVPVKG